MRALREDQKKRAWESDFFEPRAETGSARFACQDSDLFQIFKRIGVSLSENIVLLNNITWSCEDRLNRKTGRFPLPFVALKGSVLQVPIVIMRDNRSWCLFTPRVQVTVWNLICVSFVKIRIAFSVFQLRWVALRDVKAKPCSRGCVLWLQHFLDVHCTHYMIEYWLTKFDYYQQWP